MAESNSVRTAFSVVRKVGTALAIALTALALTGGSAQAQTKLFHETFGAVAGKLPTALSSADGPYLNSCVNGDIRIDPTFPGYPGDVDGTAYLFHNTGSCSYSASHRVWYNVTPISVEPNKTYRFVYQFFSRQPSNPAIRVQLATPNVGGSITAGAVSTPPQVSGVWVERYMEFVTGPGTTSVTLGIRNSRTTASGNDFGIDSLALYDISPPPFAMCTSDMYMSQADSVQSPMTLYQFDTASNPFVYTALGASSTIYNATAYNPQDNYLYGMSGTNMLVRIGSNGVVEPLGAVQNLPVGNYNAGEIGPDGTYYVKPADGTLDRLYKINLATRTATLRTLTAAFNVADIAWYNGRLYAAVPAGALMAIDPNSGQATAVGSTGAPAGHFGAMFGASNGLFGSHNAGGFYQFDVTTGAASLISSSPSANLNDGAKCVTTPLSFPADLGITKTDGTDSYAAGTDVTYTIVASNKGPFGVQNALVNDALPTGITTASWTCGTPTGGGYCPVASGSGAIADAPVNLPKGASVTFKLTLSVPSSFTGDLVNTATIASPATSPDPELSDNSATDIDKATTLTLVKNVVNVHGGPAQPSDFALSATGPIAIAGPSGAASVTNAAVTPGTYALSEVQLPGYEGGDYSCAINGGAPAAGSSVTLALGDLAVCTVTNTDLPASLTLGKTVVNANGGTAIAGDFTLTAAGPTPLSDKAGTPGVTDVEVLPGAYTLGETNLAGYEAAGLYRCSINSGPLVAGNSVTLANGQHAVCTITNEDQPARLTLVKQVVNAYGGTARIADFTLTATGPKTISGVSGATEITDTHVPAGAYALTENSLPNYSNGDYSCVINGNAPIVGNALTLALGDVAVCTVQNQDIPARLTLEKVVNNPHGGAATTANFKLTATGPVTVSGVMGDPAVTNAALPSGNYALRESNMAGYAGSNYSCVVNGAAAISGNTLSLANSDVAVCTITNDHQPATLTLVKQVVNDDGGIATVNDFSLSFTGPNGAVSGLTNDSAITGAEVPAGDYTLSETNLPGYRASPFSCVVNGSAPINNNSLTLVGGDIAVCTIVNDDIAPAVTISKALVGESGSIPWEPEPDEVLTYEITLTNTGGAANGYDVTDVLGDASLVSFVDASHLGVEQAPGVVWTNLTVPAQTGAGPGILVLTVRFKVENAGPTITNMAKKTGDPDPICPSAQCVQIPVEPRIDVSKALTAESGAQDGIAEPGEMLTYTITLTNTGGVGAVDLTDKLDPNTTFDSATFGGIPSGGIVQWSGLDVPVANGGVPGTLEVVVRVTVDDPLPPGTSKVSNIAFKTGEDEPACPSAQCVETPTAPVVTMTKTLVDENGAVPNMAEPGETLTYAIELTNTGGPATDFKVIDLLDPNVELVSASDGGVVSPTAVNWTGLTIPAQTTTPGTRVLTVRVKVKSPLPSGVAAISNVAFETDQPEPVCPSTQCVQMPTPPSVTIKKELTGESGSQNGVAEPGETLTYQITLTNTGGPATAYGVTDKLDPNFATASADNGGVPENGNIVWRNLTVPQQMGAVPGVLILTVSTTLQNPFASGVTQIANLAYETGQPGPVCPTAQCAMIPAIPAITIKKELTSESGAQTGVAEPGETLTYRITLTNTGGAASNFAVTDRLDANVSFANASDGGALSGTDVVWSGLAVPAQVGGTAGTKVLTVRTRVKDPLPLGASTVVNLAFETGTSVPSCPSLQCVELTTPASVTAAKALTGEDGSQTGVAEPGEELEYTITLSNGGGGDFANYRLTENVPLGATLIDVTDATGFAGDLIGPAQLDLTVPLIGAGAQVDVIVRFKLSDPLPVGATAIVNTISGGDLPPDCLTCSTTTPTPPSVAVEKTLTGESISRDGVAQPGELLGYTIALKNTGGSDFTDFRLTEHIPAGATLVIVNGATGPAAVPVPVPLAGPTSVDLVVATVPANDTAIVDVVFKVDDPIAGGLNAIVNTISGGDLDPGCTNCTVTVPTASNVSVEKLLTGEDMALDAMAQPGETLTYTVTLTNAGGAAFTDYQFSENVPAGVTLTSVVGATGFTAPVKGPAVMDLQIASVPAGTTAVTIAFKVDDTIADGVTSITNIVSGGNIDPACTTCEVALPTAPKVSVIKELTGESKTANTIAEPGEVLTYTVTLTNAGGSDFSNFRFTENVPVGATLTAVSGATGFGAPVVGPGTLDLVVPVVLAEDLAMVTIDFTMDDPLPSGVPTVANTISGGDIPSTCLGCSVIIPLAAPSLTVEKTGVLDDVDNSGGPTPGDTLTYEFFVTNTGNVALDSVAPIDLGPTFNGQPAANSLSAISPGPLTLAPTETQLFAATYVLSQTDIDNAAGIADGVANTATARGYRDGLIVPANAVDAADSVWLLALPAVGPSDITVTKQANLRFIRIGENASYTLSVTNNAPTKVSGLRLTDIAPPGFRYVEGSATLDGVAVTPLLDGRQIVFDNLALDGNQKLEIRLDLTALSSAGPGRHVNTAIATDADGNKLAAEATATVEILAEPIFDCGDIIGRVFDDKNRNGYQDEGEPGLPGVRLATVSGLLVTTDKHGRFSLPCAALPDQRIGTNFIMKLDVRTLPSGYSVTTENPRVVRLTAGKMTSLNFGASIGRVVQLDLIGEAFVAGGTELRAEWSQGVDDLVDLLGQEPSILHLTYVDPAAGRALATQRVHSLEQDIAQRWRAAGHRTALDIQTRVEAGR